MNLEASALWNQAAVDVSEQRFRRGVSLALGLGAALLLLLVGVAGWLYSRGQVNNALVDHTYSAQARINRLGTLVERLETARRGYLLAPSDGYWRIYVDTRAEVRPRVEEIADFTSDNPVQVRNAAELSRLVELKFAQLRDSIERAHDGDLEGGRRAFLTGQASRLTEQLRSRLAAMQDEEQRLLEFRAGEERRNAQVLLGTVVVVALLLVGLSSGTVFLMRRFADELARSQAALQSLNMGLEGAVRARTADLQRANTEIQRFAYIVSHDLRSPLVNVMGFTSELEQSLGALRRQLATADAERPGTVPRDVRDAVEADIPESIDFIRRSTQKMDRLINAILQLSRQGGRKLAPEPLDMDAMARGVADSLAKLAEPKDATITVAPRMPALVSDRLAVEQVLSNLVENAVKYLQPGRPGRVEVRGGESGGRVFLEVEDNGRGIAPQDHERIFELFRRSGPQDTPGEGIGLAHVRALVYRLGGTIACVSELGRGSTFRVSLPPTLAPDNGRNAA